MYQIHMQCSGRSPCPAAGPSCFRVHRTRAWCQVTVGCLVAGSVLWPLAAPGAITSSGDASVIPPPPAALPSYLYARRTGTGSLDISGSNPAGFPVIYLGANNPEGAATPAAQGTLSIVGANIALSSIQGNGPGTGIVSVTGNVLTFIDPAADAPRQFYRIAVDP